MDSWFLLVSLGFAWLTVNAFKPIFAPAPVAIASFFAGWLTAELALHHVALQLAVAATFVYAGATATLAGQLAFLVTMASVAGLIVCQLRAAGARHAVARALEHAFGMRVQEALERQIWRDIALPFPVRHREVECLRNVVVGRVGHANLRVNVHRARPRVGPARESGDAREPDAPHAPRPVLIYVHGGGWVIGQKRYQGLPLMQRLAARGWVCFAVDYRLSPRATFPEHLIDVKRAIAWVRDHAAEYGGDAEFVLIAGNSAGAHLASLAALTPNDPEYQPGFEHADTEVQACLALYGIYDFTDRDRHFRNSGLRQLLAHHVMKASLADAPDAYRKASPLDRIHEDAPPFFVVHGDADTLAPARQARAFCEAFRRSVRAPIAYAEIPGAQHAFEIFPSIRTAYLLAGIERFASHVLAQHTARRPPRTTISGAPPAAETPLKAPVDHAAA